VRDGGPVELHRGERCVGSLRPILCPRGCAVNDAACRTRLGGRLRGATRRGRVGGVTDAGALQSAINVNDVSRASNRRNEPIVRQHSRPSIGGQAAAPSYDSRRSQLSVLGGAHTYAAASKCCKSAAANGTGMGGCGNVRRLPCIANGMKQQPARMKPLHVAGRLPRRLSASQRAGGVALAVRAGVTAADGARRKRLWPHGVEGSGAKVRAPSSWDARDAVGA